MRRWTLGWALAACAIAAVGCGGSSSTPPPPAGPAKGVSGQNFYVTVAPAAGGAIKSGDGAIACQPDGTGCGDATYHQTKFTWATPVVLTATPAAGYQFDSWTGDCLGTTGNVCTLPGNSPDVDCTVTAVFKAVTAAPPVPVAALGRVYGYVKDGGVGVGGVSVKLGTASATTNANGAYVFEVAPGSYSLTTVASSQYAAATAISVTVPKADGVADPAGVCFLGGAKQGFWVPTAGQAIAGCLVKQSDIALTRAGTYAAPVAPPVIVTTPAMPAVVGFGANVTIGCGATGVVAQVSGPTTPVLSAPDVNGAVSFTTPDMATALASPSLATLALVKDGRPGFVSINQAHVGALSYKFSCTVGTASATVSVPLVAAVNANLANALRGEPYTMASYKGAANGLPGITGPLWAAGAETGTANPDGSTWRAHDAVQVPVGVILILDGPAGANWKFCKGAKDSYASCSDPTSTTDKLGATQTPVAGVPAITGNGTGNAWFPATWKTGTSLYLTSDKLAAVVNGFTGEPNIPVKPQIWGGWDLTSLPGNDSNTVPPVTESCGLCHVAPGAQTAAGVFELGPTEPVTGWKESKHARAGIDGGSSTHFTLQACGACHTTGWDTNLPATNVGFSAVLGSYTNDFLFEGSDAKIWEADLAAKNPAAALLNNVQCGSCHGPTPNSPNHTASLSSKVCGTCHNGYDPQYEQWATSKHANLAVAIGEGPSHGRDQTHCGRCHFGQGFFLYAQAIKSGNPDKLGNAPPVGAPATARTSPLLCGDGKAAATTDSCLTTQTTGLVTAQNVEAITCQTCHDPHSLEVRVKGSDTANGMLLAGGFTISNAGSGALCAACHNSRNGIVGAIAPNLNTSVVSVGGTPMQHNDATPLTSANFGTGGPHSAAQADVYFAGNGYLLGQPMPTRPNIHADRTWFPDTCAECHVKRLSTATKGKPSNHTFTPDDGTCAGCHGTITWIEDRKTLVTTKLAAFNASLTTVLKSAGITKMTGDKTAAIGALSKAATTSTVTATLANHGLTTGNSVKFTFDKTDAAFKSGTYAVTVVDANTFTFDDTLVSAGGASNTVTTAVNFAYDVTGLVITAVAANGSSLDFTFASGSTSITKAALDSIVNGTTPILYTLGADGTTKTYGNVVKALYDAQLITNDRSAGIHNLLFVDAMLDAMVNHLDLGGAVK